MSDTSLSGDEIVVGLVYAAALAHVGVLIWFVWLRRSMTPVIALNLLVSGGIVAYWVPYLGELFNYVESVWAFVAVEFAIFATSLLAVFKIRVPSAVIWLQFIVHAILIAAAIYFMMTFKLTRLI